jgi:NADP-dependent aldehyde dehydrogenase
MMGAGQFCTNPGFVVVPAGTAGDAFIAAVVAKFTAANPGVLLGKGGRDAISESIMTLTAAGATVRCGGNPVAEPGYRFENTILTVSADTFLKHPEALQTEAFGPVSLLSSPMTQRKWPPLLHPLKVTSPGRFILQ